MGNTKDAKKPKARLKEQASVIQKILWENKVYPKKFAPFVHSAELMRIYKILIDLTRTWQDGMEYDLNPYEKLGLVFGVNHRAIYTYQVTDDFYLNIGEFSDKTLSISKDDATMARSLRMGDIVLIRYDNRDPELKVDMQILTAGLFQDDTEDWKCFTFDSIDFKLIRPYLKLIDSEGVHEFDPGTNNKSPAGKGISKP